MDELTVQAARRGDRDALSALLGALQDAWYRMALGLLRDPERARDATQETGLRFIRQLPGFRGDSHIRTWSLGICLNVVRELQRPAAAAPAGGADDAADRLAPDAGPLRDAERAEEADALRRILAELPDRQREAVVLRFFEELSVQQAARVMRCAPGTVKATVHQALRALRHRLAHVKV